MSRTLFTKVIDYKIVESNSTGNLELKVKELIKEDWEPTKDGARTVETNVRSVVNYMQTMIKIESYYPGGGPG